MANNENSKCVVKDKCVCGVCGDSVDWPLYLESTCDGSMCISCYQEHICECEICR